MKRLFILCLAVVFLAVFSGCDGRKEIETQLNEIDMMLEECPDSALMKIEAMDIDALPNTKLRARHALLHSIALDKNYIDLKTESIIAPAVVCSKVNFPHFRLEKGTT